MQSKEEQEKQSLLKVVNQLLGLTAVLFSGIIILGLVLIFGVPDLSSDEPKSKSETALAAAPTEIADTVKYWQAPDEASLATLPNKELILYGKELIMHTADYFGPAGKVNKKSINGMNCQNCHLDAGTKVFGNNYSAVASTYPKYRYLQTY